MMLSCDSGLVAYINSIFFICVLTFMLMAHDLYMGLSHNFYEHSLKVTIITPTCKSRLNNFETIFQKYKTFKTDIVTEFIIFWMDTDTDCPLTLPKLPFHVRIYNTNQSSLMYRYLLDNRVKTEVILSIDDDNIIEEDDIIKLYEKWYRVNDTFLIGPVHRYFNYSASTYRIEKKKYNLILPSLSVTSRFHCISVYDSQWKDLFDIALQFRNVDDLFFNVIFLLLLNQKPLFHKLKYTEIKGSSPGVSSKPCHIAKRELFLSIVKTMYPALDFSGLNI